MSEDFEVDYIPHGARRFSGSLHEGRRRFLEVSGGMPDVDPEVLGEAAYVSNAALVAHLWAFAKHEAFSRRHRAESTTQTHRLLALEHRATALGMAHMVAMAGETTTHEWCSACMTEATFTRVKWHSRPRSTWLCDHCGTPTTPCLAPRCHHMAVRGIKTVELPHYCAEHRHEVASFETLGATLDGIDDWDRWLAFRRKNMTSSTKTLTAAALGNVTVHPLAWSGAGALGGMVGGFTGRTGAAATDRGLALLGGGAVARGGVGRTGAVKVVAAMGSALGGALGGATTAAYAASDRSFRVVRLRDGVGAPVLLASGFLTDKDDGWGEWRQVIDARYPERPVHRVHWGARELGALGPLDAAGGDKPAATRFARQVAMPVERKPTGRSSWLGHLLWVKDAAANPWTVASTRATLTGAILADLLARTDGPFVLAGHSLGARVMATAASLLGTMERTPLLEDVHLLGASVSRGSEWQWLDASVSGNVWNYWSTNDSVLGALHPAGSGKKSVGRYGFGSRLTHIKDRNVSRAVDGHAGYFGGVKLQ